MLEGERRELNPRIPESQPGALTTWLRSPTFVYKEYITFFNLRNNKKNENKSIFNLFFL